jgi:hypothetical protein
LIVHAFNLTTKLSGAPQHNKKHFIHAASAPTIVREPGTLASLCHEWRPTKPAPQDSLAGGKRSQLLASISRRANDLIAAMSATGDEAAPPQIFGATAGTTATYQTLWHRG